MTRNSLWKELVNELSLCEKCRLHRRRCRTVPGEGSLRAPLMLVGEGPGRTEDQSGRPFVGPAGALLEAILSRCGIQRDNLFITNVVRCHPPGNRDPRFDEIAACQTYLQRTIEIISPRILVALGRVAGGILTQRYGDPMWALQEKQDLSWQNDHMSIPVKVMYHPSYLLRRLQIKDRDTIKFQIDLFKKIVDEVYHPSIR